MMGNSMNIGGLRVFLPLLVDTGNARGRPREFFSKEQDVASMVLQTCQAGHQMVNGNEPRAAR